MEIDGITYRCKCQVNLISKLQLKKHLKNPGEHNLEIFNLKKIIPKFQNISKRLEKIKFSKTRNIILANSINSKILTQSIKPEISLQNLKKNKETFDLNPHQKHHEKNRQSSYFKEVLNQLAKLFNQSLLKIVASFKCIKEETRFKINQFFKYHVCLTKALCISPDNQYLLSGGYDGRVRLWDSSNLRQIYCLPGNFSVIDGLEISSSSKYALLASINSKIWLWDMTKRKLSVCFEHHHFKYGFPYFNFSNNECYFLLGILIGTLQIYSTKKKQLMYSLNFDIINFAKFFDDDKKIVSLTNYGILKIININSEFSFTSRTVINDIYCMIINKKLNLCYSGHYNGFIQVISLENLEIKAYFKSHKSKVVSLSLCLNSQKFTSISSDEKMIKLWDAKSFQLLEVFEVDNKINACVFANNIIYLSDIYFRAFTMNGKTERSFVSSNVDFFIPNNFTISIKLKLICYSSNKLYFFSLLTGKQICSSSLIENASYLRFFNTILICATTSGCIYFIETTRLAVKSKITLVNSEITYCNFSADFKYLAYVSNDKMSLIDFKNRELILKHELGVLEGKFNANDFIFIDARMDLFIFCDMKVLRRVGIFFTFQLFCCMSSNFVLVRNISSEKGLIDMKNNRGFIEFQTLKKSENAHLKKEVKIKKEVLILISIDYNI